MYTHGQVSEAFEVLRELITEEGADPEGRFLLDDIKHDVLNRLSEMAREDENSLPIPRATAGKVSYILEYVKCGKLCHCNDGKGHGPYWYAYWHTGKKTHCRYIGKDLRAAGVTVPIMPGATEYIPES